MRELLTCLIKVLCFKVACIGLEWLDLNRCIDCFLQGIAVTGSALDSFDSVPWIVRLREELAAASQRRQRLLGICFGCQALAISLGGDAGWLMPSGIVLMLSVMSAVVICIEEEAPIPSCQSLPCLSFSVQYVLDMLPGVMPVVPWSHVWI